MMEFEKLGIKDVAQLLKNIAISRDLTYQEHEIPASVDIHNTIFNYLREVKRFKLNKNRVSAFHEKKHYWCTCEREIRKQLLKKYFTNIIGVLFEADFLIADNPSDDFDILHLIGDISEKNIEHMSDEIKEKLREYNNKLTKTKTIKAININMAKELLCND
ncbi:hypothetical protein [Alkaliphilus serpentinus]|nr:hypothetical protein [Alkaliphilus serpentinus]